MFILDQVVKFCHPDFQALQFVQVAKFQSINFRSIPLASRHNNLEEEVNVREPITLQCSKLQILLIPINNFADISTLYSSILLSAIVQVIVVLCSLLFLDNINILNISIRVPNYLATIIWLY